MKNYLEFISDEDLVKAVTKLKKVYERTKESTTEEDFYKNQIDPIKLLFDTKFNTKDIKKTIELEIIRKKDKTISNAIGEFHEQLLGSIKGYEKLPVGLGYDIKAKDNSLYADIKNKHNTVKGLNLKDLYADLEEYVANSENEDAKAYWVQIIAENKKSFNEQWKIPKHNLDNESIYKISADQFYKLLTGKDDAFKRVCEVLPTVIDDILQDEEAVVLEDSNIVEKLTESAKINNTSIMLELFNKTFSAYLEFPIKDQHQD